MHNIEKRYYEPLLPRWLSIFPPFEIWSQVKRLYLGSLVLLSHACSVLCVVRLSRSPCQESLTNIVEIPRNGGRPVLLIKSPLPNHNSLAIVSNPSILFQTDHNTIDSLKPYLPHLITFDKRTTSIIKWPDLYSLPTCKTIKCPRVY